MKPADGITPGFQHFDNIFTAGLFQECWLLDCSLATEKPTRVVKHCLYIIVNIEENILDLDVGKIESGFMFCTCFDLRKTDNFITPFRHFLLTWEYSRAGISRDLFLVK